MIDPGIIPGFWYLCIGIIIAEICTVALGNAAVFPFCPEWSFLSRFPGLLVSGGTTYRFSQEMPLNRKFGKIKLSGISEQPKTII